MRPRARIAALLASLIAIPAAFGLTASRRGAEPGEASSPYILGYSMNRIDGTTESLEAYKGKVVMIVNVASKCGLTPQYEALERLYDAKKDAGFVVLGFPANNFMGQEPGSNEEIAEFCRAKFDVSFPMFEKVSVKGDDRCALYAHLASLPKPLGGEPGWNFTKLIVDKSGNVVARFEPKTKPDADEVVAVIDRLLKQE